MGDLKWVTWDSSKFLDFAVTSIFSIFSDFFEGFANFWWKNNTKAKKMHFLVRILNILEEILWRFFWISKKKRDILEFVWYLAMFLTFWIRDSWCNFGTANKIS